MKPERIDIPQPTRARSQVPGAVLTVVAFLIVALPFALWQVTSNSDEARYTIAAARMLATGDYIVPYAAWGEVRLLKPPLTYWYVVAGFALFGQSVFAVKSMWLASAAAILALTGMLARQIGAGRTGPIVAVAALASNLLFYRAALTHNPDIPLTLGISAALVGLVRLVSDDRPPAWAAWLAWGGVAWAVLAKGLLPLVLVALAVGVRAAFSRLRPARNEIAAIVFAIVAVGWWYVAVALQRPDALVAQFLGDQVTGKAALGIDVLTGLAYFTAFLALGFLPMLIAALPGPHWRRPRAPAEILLAAWIAVVVVIFSFSNFQVARYLLPALPAAAALLGLWLGSLERDVIARRAGQAVRWLAVAPVLVGAFSAVIVYAGGTVAAALAAGSAGLAASGALWWAAGSTRAGVTLPLLTVVLPVSVLLAWPAYRIAAYPSAADFGVRAIEAAGVAPRDVVVVRRWHLIERVGLQVPPLQDYAYADGVDAASVAGAAMVLTIFPEEAGALRGLGWSVREDHGAPEGFPPGALWSAIRDRDIAGLRARYGEPMFIATPPR